MSAAFFEHLTELGGTKREAAVGSWLFHRGDPVRALFLVTGGTIELLRHSSDGKPAVLQRAAAGSLLAEASAFSAHYHCDAVALEPSKLLEIPRGTFLALLDSDPEFARGWMTYLAGQVQRARLRSEILTLKTVERRLAAWLVFNDGTLPEKGNWRALAFEIGVTPEALYREIARRRKKGLNPAIAF